VNAAARLHLGTNRNTAKKLMGLVLIENRFGGRTVSHGPHEIDEVFATGCATTPSWGGTMKPLRKSAARLTTDTPAHMKTNRAFLTAALAALSTSIAFAQDAATSTTTSGTKTTITDPATNTTTTAIVPSTGTTTTGTNATNATGVTTTTTSTTTAGGATAAPDALVMSAGSILVLRGGQTSRLSEEVKLTDGSVVTPGGTVRRPDGSRTTLSDGQSISIDGKLTTATTSGTTSTTVGGTAVGTSTTTTTVAPAVKPQ
jgi:hypothetical protein